MIKRDLYYERIPTKSLRNDVRYLGNILGRVIKKQEGQNFFNLVEKIRLLSKANVRNINNKKRFKGVYKIKKNIISICHKKEIIEIPYDCIKKANLIREIKI